MNDKRVQLGLGPVQKTLGDVARLVETAVIPEGVVGKGSGAMEQDAACVLKTGVTPAR
jgi:hypothetical protein